mmetsp:Transcript_147973/g.273055  ORF Transcript_147973/g.273055 Transcript_147973/m.273055 type:complete len:614 (-) Transcript_147973:222-2063(-)
MLQENMSTAINGALSASQLHEALGQFHESLITDIQLMMDKMQAHNDTRQEALVREVLEGVSDKVEFRDIQDSVAFEKPRPSCKVEMIGAVPILAERPTVTHVEPKDGNAQLPAARLNSCQSTDVPSPRFHEMEEEEDYAAVLPKSSAISVQEYQEAVWHQVVRDAYQDDNVQATEVQAGAFSDLSKKERINVDEANYRVEHFYYETGCAQWLARSHVFNNLTLFVIALNAMYIGIDSDWNDSENPVDAHLAFKIGDNAFCVYFCFEWVIRFAAFQSKWDCLRDMWFKFDSFLVALMVLETWGVLLVYSLMEGGTSLPTGPLRLLRLLRLSRMARLMRSLPELITMVKGMKVASRAMCSSLIMLALLIYAFAIVIHMILKDEPTTRKYFATLPKVMWTLLIDGTFMDGTGAVLGAVLAIETPSAVTALIVFFIFILLSAMTVMNMLIGVLCEVVSAVTQNEKELAAINAVKDTILVQLESFDEDGNRKISQSELRQVMSSAESISILKGLDVDVGYMSELQNLLFTSQDAEVSIESILNLMLMCRGDLPVTVKHLISAQAFTRWAFSNALSKQRHWIADELKAMKSYLSDNANHDHDSNNKTRPASTVVLKAQL